MAVGQALALDGVRSGEGRVGLLLASLSFFEHVGYLVYLVLKNFEQGLELALDLNFVLLVREDVFDAYIVLVIHQFAHRHWSFRCFYFQISIRASSLLELRLV